MTQTQTQVKDAHVHYRTILKLLDLKKKEDTLCELCDLSNLASKVITKIPRIRLAEGYLLPILALHL